VNPRKARFDALYARYYRSIYAYVHRRLAPHEGEVADVTADVFAVAWRRLDDLPDGHDELLWLYGVARRCVARARRSSSRRAKLLHRLVAVAPPHLAAPAHEADPRHEELRVAIERLRPGDREVLKLVMWEQLSHAEAAVVLGCSANAVAQRLHTARERLRAQLVKNPARSPEVTTTT
jgi:RNA polymerase sigma-70 factor, ECF subfamily